jgi:hypothetical protein
LKVEIILSSHAVYIKKRGRKDSPPALESVSRTGEPKEQKRNPGGRAEIVFDGVARVKLEIAKGQTTRPVF